MAGHSRPKDGVASLAYDPAIHRTKRPCSIWLDRRAKPGDDTGCVATMTRSLTLRAAFVSIAIFAAFILAWHLATRGIGTVQQMDPEYAKLMGLTATQGKSAMPGPLDVGEKL